MGLLLYPILKLHYVLFVFILIVSVTFNSNLHLTTNCSKALVTSRQFSLKIMKLLTPIFHENTLKASEKCSAVEQLLIKKLL